jgi:hypothetical protein
MSSIEENIRSISERVKTNSSSMETEEARKTAVVLPFLRALGYDVFDQNEVIHEFTGDAVGKKGEISTTPSMSMAISVFLSSANQFAQFLKRSISISFFDISRSRVQSLQS